MFSGERGPKRHLKASLRLPNLSMRPADRAEEKGREEGFEEMRYQLRPSRGSSEAVAEAELPDHFAAETWARDWVLANATDDSYRLQSADGGFSRIVFKTNHGHWYLTPATMERAGA